MYIDLSRSRAAAAVNSTLEESTAYPSLVGCGPGCGVILYDLTATGTGVFNQTTKRFGFSIPRHGMIRPSRELHFNLHSASGHTTRIRHPGTSSYM